MQRVDGLTNLVARADGDDGGDVAVLAVLAVAAVLGRQYLVHADVLGGLEEPVLHHP